MIRKLDTVSKAPIAGAEFELTYANGEYVDDDFGHLSSKGRYTTNDAGEIRIPVIGTIVAKEVTPAPGYVIDATTQTQTVKVGGFYGRDIGYMSALCRMNELLQKLGFFFIGHVSAIPTVMISGNSFYAALPMER